MGGTLRIPFTAIYFNQTIEGFFKLQTPLIQLGYVKNYNEAPLISLFATLDPPILNPHQFAFNDLSSEHNKSKNERYVQWILSNHTQRDEHCVPADRRIEIFASNKRNEPE